MNSLNFLREKPIENWIDYFVDRSAFLELLNNADHEQIASLLNQFAIQGQVADKESDIARRKDSDTRPQLPRDFGDEDVNYGRRKAARLWLCALSCFAAIDWNIEVARVCCNVLVMQAILNRLIAFAFSSSNVNSSDDASLLVFGGSDNSSHFSNAPRFFVAWLYARWILHVDTKERMLDVVFKPTVSNPANQLDANLVLAEQLRSCVSEIRQKSGDALFLLERMTEQMPNLPTVPSMECFLDLIKDDDLVLGVDNSLDGSTYWLPGINFELGAIRVSGVDCRILTRYDLMCDHFAAGRTADSKRQLLAITKDWPIRETLSSRAAGIMRISQESLVGYCSALEVERPRSCDIPLTGTEIRDRYSLNSLWNSEQESSIESILEECLEGLPAVQSAVARLLSCTADFPFIAKKLNDAYNAIGSSNRRKTFARTVLQFLCLQQPTFSQVVAELEKEQKLSIPRRQLKQTKRKPVSRIPDASKLLVFLNGTVPFWRLLLSHDVNEIKLLLQQMVGKFTHPFRFDVSKVIGDAVLPKVMNSPNYEYIFLLLGKLENLAKIGDMQKVNFFCTECVKELYAIGKEPEVQLRFAFDFVRVKLENWHEKTYRSTNNEHVLRTTTELQKTVKAIVQTAVQKNSVAALSKMMVQIVTFFINTNEWEYLMKCPDKLRSPFLDVAKVLAAFITTDQAKAKKIAEGPWWQIMHPTFEDSSNKRRHDATSSREKKQLISRSEFLLLLKYIMEPRSIAFLLSFLSKMYNCVLSSPNGSDGLSEMFIEHNHFWQSLSTSGLTFSATYISECLDVVLSNALVLNPINAFWLRSYADYNFVNERYEDALILYMETCVACSESLVQPLPDNVVDDLMWVKIQRCLRHCGFDTLAMIACQQMRDPIEHYVPSAKSMVESEGSTLDACSAYFPLIASTEVAEFMNDSYEKLGLTVKSQSLVKAIAVPELNVNNPNQNERYRRRERFMRLLCSQVLQIHL